MRSAGCLRSTTAGRACTTPSSACWAAASWAGTMLLPREDDLCAMLGVSRTSVREAVKVLSAKGLVEARRRAGVRVLPRDNWRLLDPVVLGWHPAIQDDEELVSG
ncbi:MAG: FadR family transcriptional regulator, partial [Mesorhizobium sp.]